MLPMRSWKPDVPFAGIPASLGFTGGFSSPYDDAGRVRCARYHDPRGVHPMPSTSKKADVSKSFPIGDLEVKSIEFKLPEDEQDKALRKGLGSIGPHVGSDRRHRIRFRQSHEIILQRIKARGTSRFPFCSRSQSDGYKFRGSSPAGVQAPWFRSRGRESCPDSALVATVRQFAR